MVQEGRVGGRGRDDGDLDTALSDPGKRMRDQKDKPTVSLSNKRIFILAVAPPEALSPADTILVT